MKGVGIRAIQELLGHKSLAITTADLFDLTKRNRP